MITAPAPTVLITENVVRRAQHLGIDRMSGNAADWSKLGEISRNPGMAAQGITFLLTQKNGRFPWQQDESQVYADDFKTPVDLANRATDERRITINLHNRPLTESYISYIACTQLTRPAKDYDFYHRLLPGGGAVGVGLGVGIGAIVGAVLEKDPTYVYTSAAGGAVLLGTGTAALWLYNRREHRRDVATNGPALLLSPVTFHEKK